MWATMPMLPDALKLMREWGFKYKTAAFVWHKLTRLTTPIWLLVAVVAGAPWLITQLMTWTPAQQLALGALLLLALGIPPVRRCVLGPIVWGLGMQVAVVRALRNAAGGRWAVWQTPSV
jgi:hypothetical protein